MPKPPSIGFHVMVFRWLILAITLVIGRQAAHGQISSPVEKIALLDTTLTGNWSGNVVTNQGMRFQLLVRMTAFTNAPCEVTYDVVDQQLYTQRCNAASCDTLRMLWANDSAGARFEGRYMAEDQTIQGLWKQASTSVYVTFHKVTHVRKFQEPQVASTELPYEERPLTVNNRAAGVRLGGTAVIPSAEGEHPVIVFVSDRGLQDRNATDVTGHRPFLVLAHLLAERGWASVRMDDRGVGESTGDPDASIDDRAGDLLQVLKRLTTESGIDASRIFLLGHGEGGLVAVEAAYKAKQDGITVKGLVLAGTPAIDGKDLLMAHIRAADALYDIDTDVTEAAVDLVHVWWESSMADAMAGDRTQLLLERSDSLIQAASPLLDVYPAAVRLTKSDRRTYVEAELLPWISSYREMNAPERIARIQSPTLVLLAERDVMVPIESTDTAWEVFADAHPFVEVLNIPGANHGFQSCKTCTVEEARSKGETIKMDVIYAIVDWATNL